MSEIADDVAIVSEVTSKPEAIPLTRASLLDGSTMASIRRLMALVAPEVTMYTDEEMATHQAAFLKLRPRRSDTGDDGKIWVFAYGSLIWNPAFNFTEQRNGIAQGWSRALNIWMSGGRGTKEKPGLTLGLEKGGSVEGVVMCLPPGQQGELELSLVWKREALTEAYTPKWVEVTTSQGTVDALTFVTKTDFVWYAGKMEDERVAEIVAHASGGLGTNIEYVESTRKSLKALDIHDEYLERIQQLARNFASQDDTIT